MKEAEEKEREAETEGESGGQLWAWWLSRPLPFPVGSKALMWLNHSLPGLTKAL